MARFALRGRGSGLILEAIQLDLAVMEDGSLAIVLISENNEMMHYVMDRAEARQLGDELHEAALDG
jgi:hypothetical protein